MCTALISGVTGEDPAGRPPRRRGGLDPVSGAKRPDGVAGRRVLVTGAHGFFGRFVVDALDSDAPALREQLIKRGWERAQLLTWQRTAAAMQEVYRSVPGGSG